MSEKFQSEWLRGSLEMMVLSIATDEPVYGYLIQKRINLASGGKVKLPAGTLYPLLHRLEADKLIRSRWDATGGRRRKWYSVTAKGKKRLTQQANQWQQFSECVSQLIGKFATAS